MMYKYHKLSKRFIDKVGRSEFICKIQREKSPVCPIFFRKQEYKQMAGGGLMQLVAYGAQDVYLTANPQVTFFKQLYRRHSNFAMESIEQTFNGVANFGKRVTCTIARNGDLITKMYVQATLPSVAGADVSGAFSWIPYVGQFLIKNVEIEIGGQRIDKHYGDWLHIWNELTLPAGKGYNYLHMVNGNGGKTLTAAASGTCDPCDENLSPCTHNQVLARLAAEGSDILCCGEGGVFDNDEESECLEGSTLYVPLEFWFNRHTGLALPLIALQYHEVKVNIEFQELRYLVSTTDSSAISTINNRGLQACSLYVDYIYLDTEERRRFAQVAHEYLIEQLQFTGEETVTSSVNKINMSFNHPVKELIWVVQNPCYYDCTGADNRPYCYADCNGINPVAVAKIQLNGHDRFTEREGKYFNRVQPYQHHTASPATGINVYSFALKPEDLQPSGSCNFSRIDTAVLNLTLTKDTFANGTCTNNSAAVRIYATNYNVLRIMSGINMQMYLYICSVALANRLCQIASCLARGQTVWLASGVLQHCKMTWLRETPYSLCYYRFVETRSVPRVMTSDTVKTQRIGQSADEFLKPLW